MTFDESCRSQDTWADDTPAIDPHVLARFDQLADLLRNPLTGSARRERIRT